MLCRLPSKPIDCAASNENNGKMFTQYDNNSGTQSVIGKCHKGIGGDRICTYRPRQLYRILLLT